MTSKDFAEKLMANAPAEKTNLFSGAHIMTGNELAPQVEGYITEIWQHYIGSASPISIVTKQIRGNGVRVVVYLLNSGDQFMGYATNVYAISRRTKIIENLCDMFDAGPTQLCEDDLIVMRGQTAQKQVIS